MCVVVTCSESYQRSGDAASVTIGRILMERLSGSLEDDLTKADSGFRRGGHRLTGQTDSQQLNGDFKSKACGS
jgi:hypothetical protein